MDLDGRSTDQANVHALLAKSTSLAAELRRALSASSSGVLISIT